MSVIVMKKETINQLDELLQEVYGLCPGHMGPGTPEYQLLDHIEQAMKLVDEAVFDARPLEEEAAE